MIAVNLDEKIIDKSDRCLLRSEGYKEEVIVVDLDQKDIKKK